MSVMRIVEGDITKLQVDAIVNAANSSLLGGGGVDGAIHRAAGPDLLAECRTLHGCRTGEAKITGGYNLPAKHVIHTVGPIYYGNGDEAELLESCYKSSMDLARENDIHSIAFSAISTGVYGYPVEAATSIAVNTVREWISNNEDYEIEVVFCCFGGRVTKAYASLL